MGSSLEWDWGCGVFFFWLCGIVGLWGFQSVGGVRKNVSTGEAGFAEIGVFQLGAMMAMRKV